MSQTVAQAAAAYRKRRSQKLARYEAALREIILILEESAYASFSCQVGCGPVRAVNETHRVAHAALNPETNDD